MKNFAYFKADSVKTAISSSGKDWPESAFMSGGTDLLGQMKDFIYSPSKVIGLKSIKDMQVISNGSDFVRIGAAATLNSIGKDKIIMRNFPALSKAALSVASPQIRNVATIGGNICQRPRCWYYRDSQVDCLKKGGSRCFAITGRNKYHAFLGSGPCYIIHPSDTAVALSAYDAVFVLEGKNGSREVNCDDFFTLPEENVHRENVLSCGEVLKEIKIPVPENGSKSLFIKIQEREAWDFAVASIAVNVTEKSGKCDKVRIVLGAAAPKPWRAVQGEEIITGSVISKETASAAAKASLERRRTFRENRYKIEMFTNLIEIALNELA